MGIAEILAALLVIALVLIAADIFDDLLTKRKRQYCCKVDMTGYDPSWPVQEKYKWIKSRPDYKGQAPVTFIVHTWEGRLKAAVTSDEAKASK